MQSSTVKFDTDESVSFYVKLKLMHETHFEETNRNSSTTKKFVDGKKRQFYKIVCKLA